MPVNAARRRALEVDFIELLLDAAGVPGRRLDSRGERQAGGEIRLTRHYRQRCLAILGKSTARLVKERFLAEDNETRQQRDITEAGLMPVFDSEALGPPEVLIDKRHIYLEAE